MSHTCAKGFLDSNFNEAVIDKISIFHEIAPYFAYSQKSYLFSIFGIFLDQLLLPCLFYGRNMSGIYFFIFASCDSLNRSFHNENWRSDRPMIDQTQNKLVPKPEFKDLH